MSAVNVTIVGNLTPLGGQASDDKGGPVMIVGQATLTGLEVGGGPMPGGPPSVSHPPHPAFPINLPPGSWPGGGGPGAGVPPGSYPPSVEHPIVLPPDLPPTLPPPDNRPVDWKTAWTPETGWVVIGIPKGEHVTPSKSGEDTKLGRK
jgi:hypothetical protein